MNSSDILQRVKEGADSKIGDTVDILLALLRRQHTHQSYRKECFCEYCTFIRTKYTDSKIALHKIKQKFYYYDDFWNLTDDTERCMLAIQNQMMERYKIVSEMKKKKMDMWNDVL